MQSVTDDSVSDSDTSIIHIGVKDSISAVWGTNSPWSKVDRDDDALRGAAPVNIIPELGEDGASIKSSSPTFAVMCVGACKDDNISSKEGSEASIVDKESIINERFERYAS